MSLTDMILEKMSDIFKPQRKFISVLLTTVMLVRGKVNFRNMSRYSELSEKTFSRQFRIPFDFAEFNRIGMELFTKPRTLMIAAMDCGFIPKSGNETYGIAKFYNGTQSKTEKGLGISELAIADINHNTAYSVSTWQTPDMLGSEHTRIDWYLEHFVQDTPCLPASVCYLAADGYYARKKFADGVTDAGYHLISKLRHDANLRYLYTGKQKNRGRPRMYDGKVSSDDLSRFDFIEKTDNINLYTTVVNSPSLKRDIRVVFLIRGANRKVSTALLFSTDIHLSATDIYNFYKARFQTEFLFRDAKQFAGLTDCQARCEASLDFHFNSCMTAINLMKWESYQSIPSREPYVCSVASVKIRKFNEYMLKLFCHKLGLDFSSIKSAEAYHQIINHGAIAA